VLKSELSLQPIRADALHLLEIDDEMWKQDPEPLLAHEGLWPLAVLARSEQPEQLLMEVAEKVSKIADESQRNDLTAAAGILAGLRFDRSLVRRLFREEIMMQSVIYREILEEHPLQPQNI
jgi:predicted transposase YdaD